MTITARRALVTGGATGIGAAVVERMIADGYEVDFLYNSSDAEAATLMQRLGPGARGLRCDLSDADAVASLCDGLFREKPYYALVHAAGMSYDCPAAVVELNVARKVMQVNFWSLVALAAALIRGMTRSGSGRVVAVTSIVTGRNTRGNSIYSATKGAIEVYLTGLMSEVAHRGITVNAIAPGYVDTKLMAPYSHMRDVLSKTIPAGRYGTPREVANLTSFLCSDDAGYVNGARIVIDGGVDSAIVGQGAKRS